MLGNRRDPLYQESSVSACCSIPFTQFFVLAPQMPSSARLIGAPYLCAVSLLQVLVPSIHLSCGTIPGGCLICLPS